MKRKLIIASIYLSGCFTSYIMGKQNLSEDGVWTKGDRSFTIGVSIFSWISVGSLGLITLVDYCKENNEEASW